MPSCRPTQCERAPAYGQSQLARGSGKGQRRYIITPLSNASFAGMVNLARSAALTWDCIITAENARRYKPAPEVYRTAIELLGLRPAEVMMVAAHNYDLAAARRVRPAPSS